MLLPIPAPLGTPWAKDYGRLLFGGPWLSEWFSGKRPTGRHAGFTGSKKRKIQSRHDRQARVWFQIGFLAIMSLGGSEMVSGF